VVSGNSRLSDPAQDIPIWVKKAYSRNIPRRQLLLPAGFAQERLRSEDGRLRVFFVAHKRQRGAYGFAFALLHSTAGKRPVQFETPVFTSIGSPAAFHSG
jgi:hypothetical protein